MMVSVTPVMVAVNAIAQRSHGIVGLAELRGVGISQQTISVWARTGRLHRVHEGVFSVIPLAMMSIEGRWMAAVTACGPGAALSHECAAQLTWLISRERRVGLHVTVPNRSRRRPPRIVIHRPRSLDARDITRRQGIPVTTIERTIWDLAFSRPEPVVRDAYELADGNDRLNHDRLWTLLKDHPNRQGSRLIRDLLAESSIPLVAIRGWLEGLLLRICSHHSLPNPAVNAPLLGYQADFLWESARFVVEADGEDHLKRTQRDKDNARDIVLQRAGYLVRRYSSRDMKREPQVAAEVLEILRKRT
jgi:hypothetical protein